MTSASQPAASPARRWRPWRVALVCFLLLWALFWGFLSVWAPGMLRTAAVSWAQGLGRQLEIGQVVIHPWNMQVTLEQVRLRDRDGSPLFAAERIQLEAIPRALLIGHWHASMLALTQPQIHLTRAADGSWNWARFIQAASGPAGSSGPAPKWFLDWLSLSQGRLIVRDGLTQPAQTFDWQRINFNLHDLSSQPGEGGYTLSATLEDKAQLKWRGLLGLDPLASSGRISLTQLPLREVWPYVAAAVPLATPQGTLSLDLNYVFDLRSTRPRLTLSALYGHLDQVALQSPDGQSHLAVRQVALEDGIFDLQKRSLFFKRIALRDGQLDAQRDRAGRLNWLANWPAEKPAPAAKQPEWKVQVNDLRLERWQLALQDQSRAVPLQLRTTLPFLSLGVRQGEQGLALARISASLQDVAVAAAGQPPLLTIGQLGLAEAALSGHQVHAGVLTLTHPALSLERDSAGRLNLAALLAPASGTPPASATPGSAGASWQVTLPRFAMSEGSVLWRDRSLARPVAWGVSQLNGSLTPHAQDGQFDLTLQAQAARGQVSLLGVLDPQGQALRAQLTAQALPLSPLSPYLLAQTPLAMPRGSLSGKLSLQADPGRWQVQGNLGINDLLLQEPGESKPLVAWHALQLNGLNLGSNPLRLAVRDVLLDRPAARLVLDHNRVSNLRRLFGAAPAPAGSPAPVAPARTAAPLAFDVRMIHVRNADVDFADQGMAPAFATQINHLSGTISGLSSKVGKRGAIALNGLVDQAGDVRVRGALAPLAISENADVQLMFRNIPLTTLNTYSENIAGWQIQDGRLSVELHYLLNQRKLNGDNRIVVDSIKLGPQVAAPGIRHLPLSLAVAVLEDSHGRIDLHLPVSGDLDDPQFSYGGLVWQAFVNVIEKVATAPFRALGALMGLDGFDDVRFVAGEVAVTPPERQKLGQLAQMLQQHPQMNLRISGTYDPQADRYQLARARVDRAILLAAGVALQPDEPLPTVDVQDVEMQQAIKRMFAERVGRLTLLARQVSTASGPAFYDALRQEAIRREAVADADLQSLADARARGAQQYLVLLAAALGPRVQLAGAKVAHASADGVPLAIELNPR